MSFIYIILILMLLGIFYMFFETHWLQVKKIYFSNNKNALKIIQLSDLHISKMGVNHKKIISVLEIEKPDFVIITGDYIENQTHIPRFLALLQKISAQGKTYLCLGNHDFKVFKNNKPGLDKFIKDIESLGPQVLHNRSICIKKNDTNYNLIGIADLRSGFEDVAKALESCSNEATINIAFSHNPDIIFDIPCGKVGYLLCGHFHGGQIWAPFDLEFKILRKEKLCKMGITKGLHKLNGMYLYINRGLGNVCFPLRFLSRPEITIYHF